MSPKESRRTVYGTIFSFPPPPAPSEVLSSSNLIPACLITDSANLPPAPASPVSTKRSAGGIVSTRPQPTMKWSLAIQKGTATLLPDDAAANFEADQVARRYRRLARGPCEKLQSGFFIRLGTIKRERSYSP